eukprot:2847020-Amphidinium_carterae.1
MRQSLYITHTIRQERYRDTREIWMCDTGSCSTALAPLERWPASAVLRAACSSADRCGLATLKECKSQGINKNQPSQSGSYGRHGRLMASLTE